MVWGGNYFKNICLNTLHIAQKGLYLYITKRYKQKLKIMKYTIVEITDKNNPLDKERGQVYQASDLKFAKNNGDIITIVENGDNWFEVAQFLGIEATGELTLTQWKKDGTFREYKQELTLLKDGRIRVVTGVADWKGRAQKLKDGAHGQYITVFGQRRYID